MYMAHAARVLAKRTKAAAGLRRLAGNKKGLPVALACQLYRAVIAPKVLYAVDVYYGLTEIPRRGLKRILNRLARIQHQAVLAITEGLRITPTEAIDAHVHLKPFRHYVDNVCQHSALQIASLPKLNPLKAYARKASRVFPKHHQSALHHLMKAYQINPQEIEEHDILGRDLRWKPKASV